MLQPLLAGLVAAVLSVVAAGQRRVEIVPARDVSLRHSIEITSEAAQTSTFVVNGEERGSRGKSTTATLRRVVFDETVKHVEEANGPTQALRDYRTLRARFTFPGRRGETVRNLVGGWEGQRLHLAETSAGLRVRVGHDEGELVPSEAARGVTIGLAAGLLCPPAPVDLHAEWDLAPVLRQVVAALQHPVRPNMGNAEPNHRRGSKRGGRRGGRRGGPRGWVPNQVLAPLANEKLALVAKAVLVRIERSDEKHEVAVIAISGAVTGEGAPRELGIGIGSRFGRGGRGGRRDAGESDGVASVEWRVRGTLRVDLTTRRLVRLHLEGELESTSEEIRRFDRGGEPFGIESALSTTGRFEVRATCEASPAREQKRGG